LCEYYFQLFSRDGFQLQILWFVSVNVNCTCNPTSCAIALLRPWTLYTVRARAISYCRYTDLNVAVLTACHIIIYRAIELDKLNTCTKTINQTPWPESASELYRPSDRRLSAIIVPTFTDRGVSRSQCDGFLPPYSRFSRPEPLHFLSSSSSIVLMRLSGPRSRPTTSQKMW
jgi:hypothetical protein